MFEVKIKLRLVLQPKERVKEVFCWGNGGGGMVLRKNGHASKKGATCNRGQKTTVFLITAAAWGDDYQRTSKKEKK